MRLPHESVPAEESLALIDRHPGSRPGTAGNPDAPAGSSTPPLPAPRSLASPPLLPLHQPHPGQPPTQAFTATRDSHVSLTPDLESLHDADSLSEEDLDPGQSPPFRRPTFDHPSDLTHLKQAIHKAQAQQHPLGQRPPPYHHPPRARPVANLAPAASPPRWSASPSVLASLLAPASRRPSPSSPDLDSSGTDPENASDSATASPFSPSSSQRHHSRRGNSSLLSFWNQLTTRAFSYAIGDLYYPPDSERDMNAYYDQSYYAEAPHLAGAAGPSINDPSTSGHEGNYPSYLPHLPSSYYSSLYQADGSDYDESSDMDGLLANSHTSPAQMGLSGTGAGAGAGASQAPGASGASPWLSAKPPVVPSSLDVPPPTQQLYGVMGSTRRDQHPSGTPGNVTFDDGTPFSPIPNMIFILLELALLSVHIAAIFVEPFDPESWFPAPLHIGGYIPEAASGVLASAGDTIYSALFRSRVALQLIITLAVVLLDQINRYLFRNARSQGYLRFFRSTNALSRVPTILYAFGCASLLLLYAFSVPAPSATPPPPEAGSLVAATVAAAAADSTASPIGALLSEEWPMVYIRALTVAEAGLSVVALLVLLFRTEWFRRQRAAPDATADLMLPSFMSKNVGPGSGAATAGPSSAPDDSIVDRQADMIRFLHDQRSSLLMRVMELSERLRQFDDSVAGAHADTTADVAGEVDDLRNRLYQAQDLLNASRKQQIEAETNFQRAVAQNDLLNKELQQLRQRLSTSSTKS
ncbi:hypothetical protein H696_01767 [Fonticula alba]|uniref:Uncharacterized protein n=1 Tax=Fonticula alba TaxID=691883 RepID=A0A058ZEM4_FONAL|nr:hypothetical protein H696_01767 [Fonticula alba]KCV72373.1 hypothetical protein H696_01767 [Fonticula alba]|eukprot:XP_009493951.1 hypothetical protein H696_01767 [Fonticula alba]